MERVTCSKAVPARVLTFPDMTELTKRKTLNKPEKLEE
jgi:hypothetical protein